MSVFIGVSASLGKEEALKDAVRGSGGNTFVRDPLLFRSIPGSAFVYWVGKSIIDCFLSGTGFLQHGWSTAVGLQTSDDFRFLRLSSEIDPADPGFPLAKGGGVRPFYSDLHLRLRCDRSLNELKAYAETTPGTSHWSRNLRNVDRYFGHGLMWARRPHRRGWFAVLPRECIFSDSGPVLFASDNQLWQAAALLNSGAFGGLLHLLMARGALDTGQTLKYETGYVESVPVPDLAGCGQELAALAQSGWSARRSLDTAVEVSHAFVMPAVLSVPGGSFADRVGAWAGWVAEVEALLLRVQSEIDGLCFDLYGISDEDRRAISEGSSVSSQSEDTGGDDLVASDDDAEESLVELDPMGLAAGLMSWAVGVVVGRFDVRFLTGERDWPSEPDPFDPLPVCSPATLTGVDGLPLQAPPPGYPLPVSPVLVDDPGHELDLGARVRAVFDVVFGDDADRWWTEVGAVLDPRSGDVEAWLRKAFFDYHLKTYSKSRRKAPIMWPLGTRSGSYRVWLYAHQVTMDSVFRVFNDIIGPKVHVEERRLTDLRQEAGPSPSASQRKAIDAQETFVAELREFRDELAAVAPLWAPDLNDGVVIVLAPLWRLFAHHRAWSSELRDRWRKLAAGDYDWAQLAMRLWPERVIPKCAEDRSLAIAHGLEDVFWVADENNPDKWHPRTIHSTAVEELIAARTSPTITIARQHPTP